MMELRYRLWDPIPLGTRPGTTGIAIALGLRWKRLAEAAERAAETAADDQAKRMFKSVAERWRQMADIAHEPVIHRNFVPVVPQRDALATSTLEGHSR